MGFSLSKVFKGSNPPPLPRPKFQPGQLWAFTPPPGQPNARLTILRVEDRGERGTFIHIAISGVTYGDGRTTINHLPFAASAIEQSVTTLQQESVPLPDYKEGYEIWRQAFDAGQAGVFAEPVAEVFGAVTSIARTGA